VFFKGLAISTVLTAGIANAAVFGYVANPTGNSTDFQTAAASYGASVNTDINFNTHPLGPLNGSFYLGTHGVTLSSSGDSNTIVFGSGPGDGNDSSGPLSPGEGANSASNYLQDGSSPSNFTISFATPVLGAGLFIIDYFNPSADNPLTIEAFTGANGTGTSLGLFTSPSLNFQNNNRYFMGVISDANNIGSLVFTDVNSNTGDSTGIDDVQFARWDGGQVPEPGSVLLVASGMAVAMIVRRKRRA
jgi:hypothetical protein